MRIPLARTLEPRMQRMVAAILALGSMGLVQAQELPRIDDVDRQPLMAQARRLAEALEALGQPLTPDERSRLDQALQNPDDRAAVQGVQAVFDPRCLVFVEINPESRVKSLAGPAPRDLVQQGWSVFLVKVQNLAGVTAPLRVSSPNAMPVYVRSSGHPEPRPAVSPAEVADRWLDVRSFDDRPMTRVLSGLGLEYRIIQLASRDSGKREARLSFDVGQGTQDLGFRSDVDLLFRIRPAVTVRIAMKDEDGRPVMGSLLIRDQRGRVYPSQGRRLAPDFFFHPQIYRQDGETVLLPPGTFEVEWSRGPEYITQKRTLVVPETAGEHAERFELKRWIKMADRGWFSGDHHIHAAGCSHYESPTEGVGPEDMMRQVLGEDLGVGCVLSWGPCWYAQKKFFDGSLHPLSTRDQLLRYDVEVSGFPSSHTGHLCLLRLKEDDYPGTTRIEEWPSWDLPVLKWGKSQGGVVGFSHSGWGLQTRELTVPTREIPPFDGIGANEFIVDVVHDAVDFISTVDTPAPWELSIWYHTLNCGFRTRISGETDFPCIYDDKVGLGRSYVKLEPGRLDFDAWVEGIKNGRNYVSDGTCHLFDLEVGGVAMGGPGKGPGAAASELKLESPGTVLVELQTAALMPEQPGETGLAIKNRPLAEKPYWHLERARIPGTRKVPVELIVNGKVVETREIEADGQVRGVAFSPTITQSSWVAVRVYPAAHTNPVWVIVGEKPVRASRFSADWCARSVDQCWKQKEPGIRPEEHEEARRAFEAARDAYRKIETEATQD